MTSWHQGPLAALDTETTGTNPYTARAVQLALVNTDPAGLVLDQWVTLIQPGQSIPPESVAVHGITDDCVEHAAPMRDVLLHLRTKIEQLICRGRPLVIFNAGYDWPLLLAAFDRENLAPPATPYIIDPLVIDRRFDRYRRGPRTLTHLAQHYGVQFTDAHDALADCLAAIGVLREMLRRFPQLPHIDIDQLVSYQRQWHADWANGINRYWERTGHQKRARTYWPSQRDMPGDSALAPVATAGERL